VDQAKLAAARADMAGFKQAIISRQAQKLSCGSSSSLPMVFHQRQNARNMDEWERQAHRTSPKLGN